jgi:hypothetical protein
MEGQVALAGLWQHLRAAATGPLIPGLTDEERRRLHGLAHSDDPERALRAAVVLAAVDPVPATRVAGRLGVPQRYVLRWTHRYANGGIEALLR